MDETIYKIAIAGFMHDIGKFAERARGSVETDTVGFFPSEEFMNNNRNLYQPYFEGKFTHSHAVYTAAFIDHCEKVLPKKFNKSEWGLGDSFANLAAGHHKPETPLQWLIAIADRVSSGFDRSEFEQYNNEINVRDYKKTRLLTIFEGLSTDDVWKPDSLEDYRYRYPLKELSPKNIFPLDSDELRQIDSEQASKDYRELFFNFIDALEKLSHKNVNISLWFEHFDSLFMIFASHIPAATVGYVVPDVSLYDHSRTTSAIASALYQYHKETNSMVKEAIQDYKPKKFLLISGNFYGIQDFIFTEGGSTRKESAKLLRGRSFYVSLLSELAADLLCRTLGLPAVSIILNAAGRFTVLGYNTEKAKRVVTEVETQVNDWLLKNFYGQASMGFSIVEASCDDFVSGRFADLWERLSREVDRKKYSKFDLTLHGGCIENYLDSFDNELGICPFCNRRPAEKSAEVKDEYACKICADHIFIGENLVKNDQIAITTVDAKLHGKKLLEPIYGKYQLSFVSGEMNDEAKSGHLLKFWNIGISEDIAKNITAKFINGYVPKYEDEDLQDDRYLAGKKSEKKKLEMIDQIRADKDKSTPKTFSHIAVKALNFTDKPKKFRGIEALGILKADVDNLGLLFACGMRKERLTLSRLATMSRQMNSYFSIFLPYMLKTDEGFKNIYTVFAGGDDLFLIGPWNRVIEFAGFLNKSFNDYVCKNPEITLSAGIALHKPGTPVLTFAETGEDALSLSKAKGRDSITIFGATTKWANFSELEKIKDIFFEWVESGKLNNAMLFRLNEFIEMRQLEEELISSGGNLHIEDMECLKWRALFKYTVVRNIGKELKNDEKHKLIEEVIKTADWLVTYKDALRMPLWQVIYNRRQEG